MQREPLSPYQQQIKEAKSILSKINNKYYQNLRLERSEGSQTAQDLKEQLRQHHKQQNHNNRIRAMTQQFRKSLRLGKRRKTSPQQRTIFLEQQLNIVQNNIVRKDRKKSSRMLQIKKQEIAQAVREVRQSIDRNQDESVQYEQGQQKNKSVTVKGNGNKENKVFLPMLEMFIEERIYLKNMSKQQQRTHSIITQMMMLALARKNNNKLLDALDILIQIEAFFPVEDTQLKHLQSVWYLFIGQLYLLIKAQEQKYKANRNIQQRKSSIKDNLERRRQQTIMIQSLVSRRNFINRVSLTIKKLQLIHETSYQREERDSSNVIQESENGKLIISRVTETYIISYPEPSALFREKEDIVNYGIVRVSRDQESNLFPHHYPSSLEGIIEPQEYMNCICKVNSVLVPDKNCLSYATSLKNNYEPLLAICSLLALATLFVIILIRHYAQISFVLILTLLSVLIVIVACWKIHTVQATSFGHTNGTYQILKNILNEWTDRYCQNKIIFKVSQNCDLILISFPSIEQDDDLSSVQNNLQSFRNSVCSKTRSNLLRKSVSLSSKNFKYINSLNQFLNEEQKQAEQRDLFHDFDHQPVNFTTKRQKVESDRVIQDDEESQESVNEIIMPQRDEAENEEV